MLNGSLHCFLVIAGTHQHNYNHVALASPARTPKNGKLAHTLASMTGDKYIHIC